MDIEPLVPAEEPCGAVLHGDGRVEVRGVLAVGAAAAQGGGRKRAKPQRIKSFSSPRKSERFDASEGAESIPFLRVVPVEIR